MKTWTLGRKLYSGIGLLACVIVAMGVAGAYTETLIDENVEELALKTAPNLQLAEELKYIAQTYRSANRYNVVLAYTNDAAGVEQNRRTMDELHAEFNEKAEQLRLSSDRADVKDMVREALAAMTEFDGKCVEIARLAAALKPTEAAQMLGSAGQAADRIQLLGDRLAERMREHLKDVADEAAADQRAGEWTLFVMAVVGAVALFLVGYVVRNVVRALTELVVTLKQGSEQVTSAASQVSASAQGLSQGATEQAASLEETSASMEEMASMTRRNAENSQQAATLMSEVDRMVAGSNLALEDMTRSMSAITESSDRVSKIIRTIDEIAFQTNILALNAAVEAARAGEAGMGFAVVADEVRNLAQRSAQAAKDTATLIEESIANSQEGHHKVEQVTRSIAGITDSVVRVRGLVTEVSEASHQQAQGIDQVSQSVAQMEKVTQTTAANAEESAAASEELNAQAGKTMTEVARLERMVVGASAAHTRSVDRRSAQFRPLPVAVTQTSSPARRKDSAEELIPFGATGTYGSF